MEAHGFLTALQHDFDAIRYFIGKPEMESELAGAMARAPAPALQSMRAEKVAFVEW